MNPLVQLLAPLVMVLPALGGSDVAPGAFQSASPADPMVAEQVSIQQSVTIRINPRPAPASMQPAMFSQGFEQDREPRFIERKFGKCLSINSIFGVQPVADDKLLLILNDRRMVTAHLEKGCQARQFYSGMMVKRNADGQVCISRDALQSRSGASCQVTGFRQIIQIGD
ncbi:MAG: hypothetical protein KGZ65_11150 [Sphingomonadales bacterium]|nr:hypothetical protein [Sphingomonadales bacterium]